MYLKNMFCFSFAGFTFLMRHVSTSRMRAPNATASQHLIYTTPSHASYRWASQHKGRQPFHFFAFIAFIALAFMAFIAFFLAGAAKAAAAFMAFIAFAMLTKEEPQYFFEQCFFFSFCELCLPATETQHFGCSIHAKLAAKRKSPSLLPWLRRPLRRLHCLPCHHMLPGLPLATGTSS